MLTGAARVTSMAAAKVGVIGGRFRRTPPVQSAEHCFVSSSHVSALTMKAIVASENELVMEAGEPVPRLVFGGVPNLEEAKEATAELKEVLDAMYLSPGIALPLNTQIVDNSSGVIMENNTCNPGRNHVHEAFRLLSCSSTIQDIVSSVACDQKVYNAVLENPEVKRFILEHKTSSDTFEDEGNVTQEGESGARVIKKLRNLKDIIIKMATDIPSHLPSLLGSSAMANASGSDHKESITMKARKFGSGFVEKLRNLKNSAVEMASDIPNYLPNLFGSSAAQNVSGSDHKGNTQSSTPELSLGTSLTGLAIMVIMIVVFKRV